MNTRSLLRSTVAVSILLFGSRVANAACVISGVRPTVPLPTMVAGQEFLFIASADCETLRFRVQGTTFTKMPKAGSDTGARDRTYKVRLTEGEWDSVVDESDTTFTWSIIGTTSAGVTTRVTTTNELTADLSIGEISMNADEDAKILGSAMSTYSGNRIAGVGDINGDGNGDLAISTNSYSGYMYQGEVSLMYGPISGSTTIATSGADLTGTTSYGYFGWSLAGGADINGDGADDMVIGTYNPGDKAYVFYGPITADATDAAADATLTATYAYDYLGAGVDVSGDYDGDGYGEAIAMAPYAERAAGTYSTGALYVWSGPISGTLSASTADYTLGGSSSYDNLTYSGNARAAVGDINGDGLEDLAAAAPQKTPSGTAYYSAGKVYLSYGGSLSAGSYDIEAYANATVTGEAANEYLGYGISNAADYDDDGYHDLVPSAYLASVGGYSYNGVTYVFLGPLSGDIGTSAYDAALYGEMNNEYSGQTVAAGDFNDDRKSDILINATNHTTTGCSYCGGAYLALGGVMGSQDLGDAFATILGPAMYANAGVGIAFIDDWDGDGRDEVAISAPYDSSSAYAGLTSVFTGGSLYP